MPFNKPREEIGGDAAAARFMTVQILGRKREREVVALP